MFSMMSDSDITPFVSEDENEYSPRPGGSSAGSDSDDNSSSPTTNPGVMSVRNFFSKRPLDTNKTSQVNGSCDVNKKRCSQETRRPQKRHALVISSRSKRTRSIDISPAGTIHLHLVGLKPVEPVIHICLVRMTRAPQSVHLLQFHILQPILQHLPHLLILHWILIRCKICIERNNFPFKYCCQTC